MKRMIWIAAAALVVAAGCGKKEEPAPAPAKPAPIAAAEKASGAVDMAIGARVYEASCSACHAAGTAGAPKLGDREAWAPRLARGVAAMEQSALNGVGTMLPKGGNASLSDDEVKAAVAYMVEKSR
jgi:cytochrome c5